MRKLKRPTGTIRRWLWAERANLLTLSGLVVNVVLLVATGLLALYALRQWRAVDYTLKEIHAQTPAVLKSAEAAASSAVLAQAAQASSDATSSATLTEMKRQSNSSAQLASRTSTLADIATQQLNMAERPLLVISDLKLPVLVISDAHGNIAYNYDLSIENKGRSSSLNTAILQDLILPLKATYNPVQELAVTCHKFDQKTPLLGFLIQSGEKPTQKQQSWTGPSELPTLLQTAFTDPTTQDRIINARLSVCVLYQGALSPQVHHTALLYNVTITFTPSQVNMIVSRTLSDQNAIFISPDHLLVSLQNFINGISD